MDHKSVVNSSAIGCSTNGVQQPTLRSVFGEQDMHKRVNENYWGWFGCWKYCSKCFGSFFVTHTL